MKNRILLGFAALGLMMSNCSNEELNNLVVSNGNTSIKVAMEQPASSRASLDDEGVLTWIEGDKMQVYTTAGEWKEFAYNTTSGEFEGTLDTEEKITDYAIYPSVATPGTNAASVTLPAAYTLGDATDNVNAIMLASDIEEGAESFSLKHLGGVIRFSVTNVPAGASKLVFTADNTITGSFDIADGQIEAPETKVETDNVVTLNFTATDVVKDLVFYVPVPVGNYTMAVALYADDELLFKKEGTTENDIERANLLVMPEVDCDDFWYDESLVEYVIKNETQMKEFAEKVNSGIDFKGKTVKLGADLDLTDVEWIPIGYKDDGTQFKGTFDGCNNIISNLTIDVEREFVGLFGYIEHDATTIKNLNLTNVDIKGNQYVAAIAGYAVGAKIDKCVVDGGSIAAVPILSGSTYNRGGRAGGITGYTGQNTATAGIDHNTNITNCEVKNLEISAYYNIGGITAYAKSAKIVFTENKVEDCVLTADQSSTPYNGTKDYDVNVFIGSFDATPDATNTSSNVTINKVAMTIATADELVAFASSVNDGTTYAGQIVKLGDNIDMAGKTWVPIGNTTTNFFKGVFDGCDKTISNLTCTGTQDVGLFGYIQYNVATIKNVVLADVNIVGRNYVGAIIGRPLGAKIDNCTVEGGSITIAAALKDDNTTYDWGDKVGGIAGYTGSNEGGGGYTKAVISNCNVKDVAIKGYRNIGGIVGCAKNTDVTDNSIEDVTITIDNTHNYEGYTTNDEYLVADIIGRVQSNVTQTNNTGTATITYPF